MSLTQIRLAAGHANMFTALPRSPSWIRGMERERRKAERREVEGNEKGVEFTSGKVKRQRSPHLYTATY